MMLKFLSLQHHYILFLSSQRSGIRWIECSNAAHNYYQNQVTPNLVNHFMFCRFGHISHLCPPESYCSRCSSDSWQCPLSWGREEKDPPSCILPGYWDIFYPSHFWIPGWHQLLPCQEYFCYWSSFGLPHWRPPFWHHKTVIPKMFHLLVERECLSMATPLHLSHPVWTGVT